MQYLEVTAARVGNYRSRGTSDDLFIDAVDGNGRQYRVRVPLGDLQRARKAARGERILRDISYITEELRLSESKTR